MKITDIIRNLVAVTGLTGGTAGKLDAILTVDVPVGAIAIVHTGTTLSFYELVTGTDAENSPDVIRPDDYATTTNEKVWKKRGLAGTQFGSAISEKIGFFGATPIVQPANANQVALTDSSGGTANDTIENCATVVTGVDGTGSNAASKADVDTRLVSIANNFADLTAKVNTVRQVLVDLGLWKGAA